MSHSFDPYLKWLGIAPKDQPPHHYRLLGVDPYMDDPDVIENAADQRMAHIRRFSTGEHTSDSQRILNEIAAARVCLLNKQQKKAYDQALRDKLAPAPRVARPPLAEPPRSAPAAPPVSAPVPLAQSAPPAANTQPAILSVRGTARLRRRRRNPALGVALGTLIGAAVLAAVYTIWRNDSPTETPGQRAPAEPSSAVQNSPPGGQPSASFPPRTPAASGQRTVATRRDVDEDQTLDVQAIEAPPTEPGGSPAKPSLPSEAQYKAALASLRRQWAVEYEAASKPEQKAALAEKLRAQASAPAQGAADIYVMLDESRRLGAEAGEAQLGLDAVDSLAARFDLETAPLKLQTLELAAEKARFTAQHTSVVKAAVALGEQWLAADTFDAALKSAEISVKSAQKARDFPLARDLLRRQQEVQQLASRWKELAGDRQRLTEDPGDATAQLSLGKFWCFERGKWERGLPMLAQGADPQLQELAQAELAANRAARQDAELADGWRRYAATAEASKKLAILRRAQLWYVDALRHLPPGSDRLQAARGFAAAHEESSSPLPTGAVLLMTFENDTFQRASGKVFVRDLSGAENHGLLTGAKPTDGQAGKALAFDGPNQHVDCQNSISLALAETMSVCAWAKPVGFRDGGIDIVGKWSRGKKGFILRHEYELPDFALGDGLAWHSASASSPSAPNVWRHLVGTYDGKTQCLYVDGQRVAELELGARIALASSPLRIGGSTHDKSHQFVGVIDEVAVFNRCLTEDEAQTLYYLGLAGRPLRK